MSRHIMPSLSFEAAEYVVYTSLEEYKPCNKYLEYKTKPFDGPWALENVEYPFIAFTRGFTLNLIGFSY